MASTISLSIDPVAAKQALYAAQPPQFAALPPPRQRSALGSAAAKVGAWLYVLARPAAGALIIASVLLAVRYKKKTTPKQGTPSTTRAIRPITRSLSLALMHGGEKAIQRFKEFHKESFDEAKLKAALEEIREALRIERIDFVDLYGKIGIFEMTEKEDEVIKLLEEALEKAKKVATQQVDEHTHTTHELKLLLAEMLIYERKFEQALKYLPTEAVSSTADARVPLYKAVIYTLTNKQDLAEGQFDKYTDIRNHFHGNKFYKDAPMYLHVSNFKEFQDLVKNIQKEIQTAHLQTKDPQPGQETMSQTNLPAPDTNTKQAPITLVDTPESTSKGSSHDSQAGGSRQ